MNRIILKVQLFNKADLKITLVYIDQRFLTTNFNNMLYFNSNDYDFLLYSSEQFSIEKQSLRIPNYMYYKPGCCQSTKKFETDYQRKIYLNSLHKALLNWSENFTLFKNETDYEFRPKNIRFNGEYWIL
jgi:hypothetical protein